VLLIGADNWLAFDRWGHYEDILATHRIAIYPRAGYPIEASTLPEGVMLMDTELYNVSSSDIRRRVAVGLPIAGMVPPAIENDVMRMYGSANGQSDGL
jgi:nicotinate-nucleotide adenylyltransferase